MSPKTKIFFIDTKCLGLIINSFLGGLALSRKGTANPLLLMTSYKFSH